MSAPIAGRRRGIASSTEVGKRADAAPPDESGLPDWLMVPTLSPSGRSDTYGSPTSIHSVSHRQSDGPTGGHSQQSISPLMGEAQPSSPLPFFLDPSAADPPFLGPSNAPLPKSPFSPVPFAVEQDQKEKKLLMEELNDLVKEQQKVEEAVKALENATHSECEEVKLLTGELEQYRKEIEQVENSLKALRQSTRDETSLQQKEQEEHSRVISEAYAVEKRAEWESMLTSIKSALETQQAEVEAKELLVVQMKDRLGACPAEAAATAELESKMIVLLRKMRGDFNLYLRPLLSHSIHEHFSSAQVERLEVEATDFRNQREMLDQFKEDQKQKRDYFIKEQRARHVKRMDDIYGAVRRQWLLEKQRREEAVDQQLSAFKSSLLETSEKQRNIVESSLASYLTQSRESFASTEKALRIEERHYQEKLRSDLSLYQQRVSAELASFKSSRDAFRRPSGVSDGVGAAHRCLDWSASDRLQSQVKQLKQIIRRDMTMLQGTAFIPSLMQGEPASRLSPPSQQQKEIEEKEREWERSLIEAQQPLRQLQLSTDQLNATLRSISDKVKSVGHSTHESRQRLLTLQEGVRSTRRAWERNALRQISRVGVNPAGSESDGGSSLRTPEMWVNEFLLRVKDKGRMSVQLQQKLRELRLTFTRVLGLGVGTLEKEFFSVMKKVREVLEVYEEMRGVETNMASQKGLLEAAQQELVVASEKLQADTDSFHAHRGALDEKFKEFVLSLPPACGDMVFPLSAGDGGSTSPSRGDQHRRARKRRRTMGSGGGRFRSRFGRRTVFFVVRSPSSSPAAISEQEKGDCPPPTTTSSVMAPSSHSDSSSMVVIPDRSSSAARLQLDTLKPPQAAAASSGSRTSHCSSSIHLASETERSSTSGLVEPSEGLELHEIKHLSHVYLHQKYQELLRRELGSSSTSPDSFTSSRPLTSHFMEELGAGEFISRPTVLGTDEGSQLLDALEEPKSSTIPYSLAREEARSHSPSVRHTEEAEWRDLPPAPREDVHGEKEASGTERMHQPPLHAHQDHSIPIVDETPIGRSLTSPSTLSEYASES